MQIPWAQAVGWVYYYRAESAPRSVEKLCFDQPLDLEVWERECDKLRTRALCIGLWADLGYKRAHIGQHCIVFECGVDEVASPGFGGCERIRLGFAARKDEGHGIGRRGIYDQVMPKDPLVELFRTVRIASQVTHRQTLEVERQRPAATRRYFPAAVQQSASNRVPKMAATSDDQCFHGV
jgi:hypothetical protein